MTEGFDILGFLKNEMRLLLEEEWARGPRWMGTSRFTPREFNKLWAGMSHDQKVDFIRNLMN